MTSTWHVNPWSESLRYPREERAMRAIRVVRVVGDVDVICHRMDQPRCTVVAPPGTSVANVVTRFEGDTLIVEQLPTGATICGSEVLLSNSNAGSCISIRGNGNVVAGRNITMLARGPVTIEGAAPAVVALGVPMAPDFRVQGSGTVSLHDLGQDALSLTLEGSGDIHAFGYVTILALRLVGSGDINTRELVARSVSIELTGSGQVSAFAEQSVAGNLIGSGDIEIFGRPRDRKIAACGDGAISYHT